MGLWNFLRDLIFGFSPAPGPDSWTAVDHASTTDRTSRTDRSEPDEPQRITPVLVPLRYGMQRQHRHHPLPREADTLPYKFARFSLDFDGYLDLTTDGDPARLREWGLPYLQTPETIAEWIGIPVGQLAWLVHRFLPQQRPENEASAHYHYRWIAKRRGGHRLIEAPKPILQTAQTRILDDILNRVPAHPAAHGFVPGRSIVTNAREHVGRRVIVKFDLQNFYPSVKFRRVVAIFRGIGYCREAAIWLGRLTTSSLPPSVHYPRGSAAAVHGYSGHYLPQGAPTSPALANLSAFSLDVRLAGLAKSFGANYTRYADDLTFSGSPWLIDRLYVFIPLIKAIIKREGFTLHRTKTRVVRDNQRQVVTGVVVNEKPNISRADFDRLKAILTNCVRHGPVSQNRDHRDDFRAHLRGRIAHVSHLNAARGEKLMAIFEQIDWAR